jgi:hypothetical protein
MFLKTTDVEELERYLAEFREAEESEYWYPPEEGSSVDFFAERPHLLLPLGFDESRALIEPSYGEYLLDDEERSEWIERGIEETKAIKQRYGLERPSFEFGIEYIFRASDSGLWNWFVGLEGDELRFRGSRGNASFSANRLVDHLNRVVASPDNSSRTLWLPRYWTMGVQEGSRISLGESVSEVMAAIANEKKQLRELKPRTLEEIVAELLRRRGMEIFLTPETRDGGRDIIARGELIPGEPLTIAVEVKHKKVVGVEDIHSALWANRDFPAVMLATSGRFSAGVLREKRLEQNHLRLVLKDGVALSQWIRAYARM